jgi:hypothetical protein
VFLQPDHWFKAETTVSFYVRSSNSFVAVRADGFDTLVALASRLRDRFGEVSSLARIAPNFSSASTVRFLPDFVSNSDPFVFSVQIYHVL